MSIATPGVATTNRYLDEMAKAYAETALWSESCNGTAPGAHNDDSPCDGTDCDLSLDQLGFVPDDISFGSEKNMYDDCAAFLTTVSEEHFEYRDAVAPAQMGHDFWLTRNGHGTGFWDRGNGEMGEYLANLARPFGEAGLWVGGDGSVYYQV